MTIKGSTFFILLFGVIRLSNAQTKTESTSTAPVWSEVDRKYLVENLIRSKEEIIAEIKNLSKEQWNFKESSDRWSINQIVEHICLYELIQMNEISVALRMGALPDFTHYLPDSAFINKDVNRLRKNITTDYTKPFTYSVPLGNNDGRNNVIWLTTMRNESVDFLQKTNENLRVYYICFGPNIHQRYMMFFQHTFRHLDQIREVKAHPKYPKK